MGTQHRFSIAKCTQFREGMNWKMILSSLNIEGSVLPINWRQKNTIFRNPDTEFGSVLQAEVTNARLTVQVTETLATRTSSQWSWFFGWGAWNRLADPVTWITWTRNRRLDSQKNILARKLSCKPASSITRALVATWTCHEAESYTGWSGNC